MEKGNQGIKWSSLIMGVLLFLHSQLKTFMQSHG